MYVLSQTPSLSRVAGGVRNLVRRAAPSFYYDRFRRALGGAVVLVLVGVRFPCPVIGADHLDSKPTPILMKGAYRVSPSGPTWEAPSRPAEIADPPPATRQSPSALEPTVARRLMNDARRRASQGDLNGAIRLAQLAADFPEDWTEQEESPQELLARLEPQVGPRHSPIESNDPSWQAPAAEEGDEAEGEAASLDDQDQTESRRRRPAAPLPAAADPAAASSDSHSSPAVPLGHGARISIADLEAGDKVAESPSDRAASLHESAENGYSFADPWREPIPFESSRASQAAPRTAFSTPLDDREVLRDDLRDRREWFDDQKQTSFAITPQPSGGFWSAAASPVAGFFIGLALCLVFAGGLSTVALRRWLGRGEPVFRVEMVSRQPDLSTLLLAQSLTPAASSQGRTSFTAGAGDTEEEDAPTAPEGKSGAVVYGNTLDLPLEGLGPTYDEMARARAAEQQQRESAMLEHIFQQNLTMHQQLAAAPAA